MAKRFLITGGAGFLGINLTRYLVEKGFDVTSLDIAKFDYPDMIDKIRVITGDIRNTDDLDLAMKDVDIVVHAAAALPLYSEQDIYSTDVDGTRNVLEVAFRHNIKQVIFISSTSVYGIPDHHPLYETDPLIGVGPYGKSKIKAEEICHEYRKKGMIVPILRPKSFIGPERLGVFALFYDWARCGKNFPMIGKGNNLYQFLDVADLCDAIYSTTTLDENIVNDTFNIGAKEFSTMKNDYQYILDYAGFGKKIICFPEKFMIICLKILEFMHLSPLYKWVYETAGKESFVSIDKATKLLGFNPKYSNKDALLRNYKWYLENLSSFEHKSGVSHRVPWSQGILKIAKLFF
ncbi:MAG: NAD(P)-dependent oxidoreductase [Clostridiales bacterium]|nr:NAD(P)-dependent oxidoreductase [Clostridiales bacterium]